MIAQVYNQNFGFSVACDNVWAAVGNPNPFRFNPLTSSINRTGSVEVYKYNINTDVHDVKTILYRPATSTEQVLLSTELNNTGSTGPYDIIHTEYTGSIPYTADKDLMVDSAQYYTSSEDGYGWAIDIRNTLLAVGNPYYRNVFTFSSQSLVFSGSGYVDLFDLSVLDIDPYANRTSPTIIGTGSIGGYITVTVDVPSLQNYSYVIFQTKDSSPTSTWLNVAVGVTSNSGGDITIPTYYTTSSIVGLSQ